MIDTDKYEGHTPAPWMIDDNNICDTYGNVVLRYHYAVTTANHTLMADAPLLLEEVKRLREVIQNALYLFQEAGNPKMSDKKRLDTICDALLEVIE